MAGNDFETSNLLVQRFDQPTIDALRPHFSRVGLEREQCFTTRGQRLEAVVFPEGGIASCVASEGGARTEVGLVGIDGMIGLGALLGDGIESTEILMQVDGTTGLVLPIDRMRAALAESEALRRLVDRYALCFQIQLAYALVSCAQHLMEARLARWLLMCHDRLPGDEIPLTHEFMAMMISAQRSGVTVTLHTLEGAGMIRSTRGLVTIRDRAKLAELAGDSYGIPEARYRDLIGPFGK
ncbi:MAG: Crp/Fnr family transcriptional regulator [Porphyrobacter sp.]|nr:Crp/Fnr family transcriptional regulator [Porphyrobacter sp.]